jgi:predicted DCC family thiol-disulfide oxidoreductase YuxK
MPQSPHHADRHPIILFDGVCNFCNAAVNFLIDRDPEARLRFAALQSPTGRALLTGHGLPADYLEGVVLIEAVRGGRGGRTRARTKSDAGLHAYRHLAWPWNLGAWAIVVPAGVRDAVYDVIAEWRYRLFGKSDACRVPTPQLRGRFLE